MVFLSRPFRLNNANKTEIPTAMIKKAVTIAPDTFPIRKICIIKKAEVKMMIDTIPKYFLNFITHFLLNFTTYSHIFIQLSCQLVKMRLLV